MSVPCGPAFLHQESAVLDKLSGHSPVLEAFDIKSLLSEGEKTFEIIVDATNTPSSPAFLNFSSATAAILHLSNWLSDHTLDFVSDNQHPKKLSISGDIDHTSGCVPSSPVISLPVSNVSYYQICNQINSSGTQLWEEPPFPKLQPRKPAEA